MSGKRLNLFVEPVAHFSGVYGSERGGSWWLLSTWRSEGGGDGQMTGQAGLTPSDKKITRCRPEEARGPVRSTFWFHVTTIFRNIQNAPTFITAI